MTETVVCILHQSRGEEMLRDRASQILDAQGVRLEWCCPKEGDPLPPRRAEHSACIVYGGPQSANDPERYLDDEVRWIRDWVASGTPYLGICLGAQMLARSQGADVTPHPEGLREIGYREVAATEAGDDFMDGLVNVYHWHGEGFSVPPGAELLATGRDFPNQAFRLGRAAYGLQFHPEVDTATILRWTSSSAETLAEPGAHSVERQLADAARHEPEMHAWLERFLDRWLGI